jgi:hypothetical protein
MIVDQERIYRPMAARIDTSLNGSCTAIVVRRKASSYGRADKAAASEISLAQRMQSKTHSIHRHPAHSAHPSRRHQMRPITPKHSS